MPDKEFHIDAVGLFPPVQMPVGRKWRVRVSRALNSAGMRERYRFKTGLERCGKRHFPMKP